MYWHNTKRIIFCLINTSILLFIYSCGNPSVIYTKKVQESIVYLRGEDLNKQELLSTATGFIIARKDSFFSNKKKYFVLTARHSIEGIGKSVKFKITPYFLRNIYYHKREDYILRDAEIFEVSDKNQFIVEHIVDIDELDVSIISFDSEQSLPVPYISASQLIEKNTLILYGFTKCNLPSSTTQTQIYAHHKMKGKISNDKDIIERKNGKKILEKIQSMEKNIKQQGIDLRYSNLSMSGMSGSPIVETYDIDKEWIVGIQNMKISDQKMANFDNCSVQPKRTDYSYSYGTSMKKIIEANNFPKYIKEAMKIESLK